MPLNEICRPSRVQQTLFKAHVQIWPIVGPIPRPPYLHFARGNVHEGDTCRGCGRHAPYSLPHASRLVSMGRCPSALFSLALTPYSTPHARSLLSLALSVVPPRPRLLPSPCAATPLRIAAGRARVTHARGQGHLCPARLAGRLVATVQAPPAGPSVPCSRESTKKRKKGVK